jgi:spermidine synthase
VSGSAAAIFLVSFATLLLQIGYTRIFSFKLSSSFTYLVIGLAMLGVGSGGVLLAVSERLRRVPGERLLAGLGPAGGAAIGLGYAVVSALELSLSGEATSAGQLARLALLCAALYAGFLALGLAVASILAARPEAASRLYAADLVGAATGCALALPLLAWLTPPGCVLASGAALAVAGALRGARGWAAVPALATAGALALGAAAGGRLPDPVVDPAKHFGREQLARLGTPVFRGWSPVFRVDVVDLVWRSDVKALLHDGLWGSGLWSLARAPDGPAHFDRTTRRLPFAVTAPGPRVLVIGAAGGYDVQAALHFGASRVVAVELNPVTVSLLEGPFAEFTGQLARDPRVELVNAEGRGHLRRDPRVHDLVYFVAPDSFATMNAAQASGFVLVESYLYTVEAIREALARLAPGGVLAAQFGEVDYGDPMRTPRWLATARRALGELGVRDFARHVLLATTEEFPFQTSTVLIQATPFSEAQVERFVAAAAAVPDTVVRHAPGRARERGVIGAVIELPAPRLAERLARHAYAVGPVFDDAPYFWHFARFADLLAGRLAGHADPHAARGERALLAMLGVASTFAFAFLILPFVRLRGRWRALPARRASAAYFAALGLGFIGYEVCLIQKLTLLLGHPTRSLSVTLFALLLFSGIGSWLSARSGEGGRSAGPPLAAALAAVTAFLLFGFDRLAAALGGADLPWRVGAAVAVLAPLGLALGAFLPLGIRRVAAACAAERRGEYVAWCWAVNGFASVLGSLLVTIGSMSFGFRAVLVTALALYLLAGALLREIRA